MPYDQGLLLEQLENAYRVNYLKEEEIDWLCPNDSNTQVVSEALRIHLLPPELLIEEFDRTLKKTPRVFIPVLSTAYDEEVKKIRQMDDAERDRFGDDMMRALGHEPHDGGGYFVTRASCGPDVYGLAIDPETMETLTTDEFGLHHLAGHMLAQRLFRIEIIRKRRGWQSLSHSLEMNCERRVISGLVLTKVDGFTVPIARLHFDQVEDEAVARVATFLLSKKNYLPVDVYGRIMGVSRNA